MTFGASTAIILCENSTGVATLRNPGKRCIDDESVIEAYLAGERWATDHVSSLIVPVIRLKLWDLLEQEDDVVQEVHWRLLEKLKKGKFPRSLKSYVQRIALYVYIDMLRRWNPADSIDNPGKPIELLDRKPSPLEKLITGEVLEALTWAWERLPRRCKSLLRLRFWEEQSHREIAELMGIAEATSRTRLARCIDNLGVLLERWKKGER